MPDIFIGMRNSLSVIYSACLFVSGLFAQEAVKPDAWIDRLADIKEAELHALAKQLDLEVPTLFTDCFPPVRERDWDAFLARKTAMYADLKSNNKAADATTPASPISSGPLQEFLGTIEMLDPGGSTLTNRYMLPSSAISFGREVLDLLPEGAIYFGGTDQGRFFPQSAFDLSPKKDVSMISQNPLADPVYMDLIRARFSETLTVPSKEDVSAAFQTFQDDAATGRYHASGTTKLNGGKLAVNGVQDVMYINGLILKQMIETNPSRPIFVEESYQIKWMQPHLVPHEMILKFVHDPKPITKAEAQAAIAYWEKRIPNLLATPEPEDAAFRQLWSKLSAAQAGLLQNHGHQAEAPQLFDLGLKISPESSEVLSRRLYLLFEMGDYQDAIDFLDHFEASMPRYELLNSKRWRQSARALLGVQKQLEGFEAQVKNNPRALAGMSSSRVLHLLGLALNLQNEEAITRYLRELLSRPEGLMFFPKAYEIIEKFKQPASRATTRLRRAVDLLLKHHPGSVDGAFYDAILTLREGDKEGAWAAVEKGLRAGKEKPAVEAQFRAEATSRLRPILRDEARFEDLLRRVQK